MAEEQQQYTYVTKVREEGEPTYTFAELKYGKIVAVHKHWVPLEDFRKFFEADAFFIDITGLTVNEEEPAVGDVVKFGEHGYEIEHYKTTYNFTEAKLRTISLLKLERDRLELLPIEYNGNLFDCDKTSIMRIDRARQALEDTGAESINWTTADNKIISVTVDDFKGINAALASRSSELHKKYNELKSMINDVEDEQYLPTILQVTWDWDTTMAIEDVPLDETATAKVGE